MGFDKKNFIVLLIIVVFGLVLFMPNIIDLIPSHEVKFTAAIIFSLLAFLFLIYITYSDIRKKQYTTTVYIVILDIIQVVVFAIVGYMLLNNSPVINSEILLRVNHIRAASLMYALCSSILLDFLKSERFVRKN